MKQELKKIRKRCLEIAYRGGDANLQSCFSSFEILYALYHGGMNWSIDISTAKHRDVFMLSKGQASLALTTILEDVGLFNPEEVNTYCKFGSRFSMQLDYTKFFQEGGIENSAGSLGHGFPMGVGRAYAKKIKKDPSRIYVLAGDGEMNEGTMWEGCAFAGGHHLDNITLIVDDNQSIGKMLDLLNLKEKLEAFGFFVAVTDGHDVKQLKNTLSICETVEEKPKAILAHTVRGYGSQTLMEKNEWFHKAPDRDELVILQREVDAF